MSFAITNITGLGYNSYGAQTITIPTTCLPGETGIIITVNGKSEDNSKNIPVVPSDFIQMGISSASRTIYYKILTSSDIGRSMVVKGGVTWGYVFFTAPPNYKLAKVISTTEKTIDYDSNGSEVAIVSDLFTVLDINGYRCINSAYYAQQIFVCEFSPGTRFKVPRGSYFTSDNYPHLIFQPYGDKNITEYGKLGSIKFCGQSNCMELSVANTSYVNKITASDVLIGNKHIYVINCNLNLVYVYNKNKYGTFDSKYKNKNWYSQDPTIGSISTNGSSVSSAFTIFTENGIDKLVGWSMNSPVLYQWDVIDGNLSNRVSYNAPFSMPSYSRCGWDGENYVYFADRTSNYLYRWDIRSKDKQPSIVILLQSYSLYASSAFTASGLIIDYENNEVYATSGADKSTGFLSFWDLTTGQYRGTMNNTNQMGVQNLNGTIGSIILDPTNRSVGYYISMYQSYIIQMDLNTSLSYKIDRYKYNYTGEVQTFTAMDDGLYSFECYGASGGDGLTGIGANGGYSCGAIIMKAGETIYLYVGGKGIKSVGGWNGGGSGGTSGGGGGASDIRTEKGLWNENLDTRIIVAGGGGGASRSTNSGAGGGEIGSNSQDKGCYGGSQTSGGKGHYKDGAFGVGGDANSEGGAGGGGWFGGGGGQSIGSLHFAGGGGSGYIGGVIDGEMKNDCNLGDGQIVITRSVRNLIPHYVLLDDDGKYYIPTREFYDIYTEEFIPVSIDFLRDYKTNFVSFIYDINLINTRMYLPTGTNFLPLDKLNSNSKKYKIIKIVCKISDISDAWNKDAYYYNKETHMSNKPIQIKYNTLINPLYSNILLFKLSTQYNNCYKSFIDIGKKSNIKVLVKSKDKYYGKYLKETTLDKILIDGIDGNELDSYNINLVKFDLCFAFKSKCDSEDDKLTKIEIHSREFENMQKINSYTLFHDTEKDKVYVKFNKDFNNILIKKLDNTSIDGEYSIGQF